MQLPILNYIFECNLPSSFKRQFTADADVTEKASYHMMEGRGLGILQARGDTIGLIYIQIHNGDLNNVPTQANGSWGLI